MKRSSLLPEISVEEMSVELQRYLGDPVSVEVVDRLHRHYLELRTWNRRVSLVSLESVGESAQIREAIGRHYGESLLALRLMSASNSIASASVGGSIPAPTSLWDIGSGGGFPGAVLAAALPSLEVTLVEARQRKWAFLCAATRKMGLPCKCLNARVGRALLDSLSHEDSSTAKRSAVEGASAVESRSSSGQTSALGGPPEQPTTVRTVDWVVSRAVRMTSEIWKGIEPLLSPNSRLLLWVGRETPEVPDGFVETGRVAIPESDHRAIARYDKC